MVHGQGLGDLQESDELEPVESLGAGLVGVDLGQSGVDGRVGGDQAVDVRESEESPDGVQHGVDREVPQSSVVKVADVELEVGPLEPDQRIETVGLAPGEPATQLVGVQPVGLPGVPSQVGDGRQLGRRHRIGLERQGNRADHSGLRRSGDHGPVADRRTRRGHLI